MKAKNSLNHSVYLCNAGNIIQSEKSAGMRDLCPSFFLFLQTWVHTLMCTSTLRRDERLFEPVLSVQLSMYKPVTGNASSTQRCFHANKKFRVNNKNVRLRSPIGELKMTPKKGDISPLQTLHLDAEHIHTAECIHVDVFKIYIH